MVLHYVTLRGAENLIVDPENEELPCFLCGKTLEIRHTKRNKPYFICQNCGIQAFVRYDAGIKRLDELVQELDNYESAHRKLLGSSFEVMSLISRLIELKDRFAEIDQGSGLREFLTGSSGCETEKRALAKEIRKIKSQLNGPRFD